MNNETYINYLERLKVVALSLFEWVNLPKSMNPEFLELCLYNYGQASMLYTEEYGYINTKCVTNGNLNLYLLPSSLSCYSADSVNYNRKLYNGFKNEVDDVANYCILVMNNFEAIPTEPTLQLFALRLYEAERTCDVNIKAQKTPVVLVGDEAMQLALQNLFLKYTGNEPVIYADKKQLSPESIKAIRTEAPFVADKLMDYKKQIWNEALTFLGINNIAIEKKERLVTDEANSNNELINLNLQSMLVPRQEACKQFNKLLD